MGSNTFGNIFKITTWGESHGKAIGVVIDGCPAGLEISEQEIQEELQRRIPGKNNLTSPRKEKDIAHIFSGIFEGKTTGAPLSIVIFNTDVDSSKYEPIKNDYRPGHANFTYLQKYGIFDYRGGGRASARETACRVAAGAVAKKLLHHFNIEVLAFVKEIGGIEAPDSSIEDIKDFKEKISQSPVFCPDEEISLSISQLVESVHKEKDSLGGIIEFRAYFLPVGIGDPIYEKLEANLAHAMLSIPATKGIEFGSGFQAARMKGSSHNDAFTIDEKGQIITKTNHAGGTLGGITTGMPLIGRVAFKPTSSILKMQETIDIDKKKKHFSLPEGSRHDPCLALRAVPIVEAMSALVIADSLLMNRASKI